MGVYSGAQPCPDGQNQAKGSFEAPYRGCCLLML
jgi:hypothetical protein